MLLHSPAQAGHPTTAASLLACLVPPKITYLSNETASEFDKLVTLTCEASGDPTPTISWSFENRVFTEGEQVPFRLPPPPSPQQAAATDPPPGSDVTAYKKKKTLALAAETKALKRAPLALSH